MNRLRDEASLYLRQHADNPVDWYPWGDEALARAADEDRPVLLSIGYSACHWCHVMAHESFEDPDTAAVMNARFVNVKVDREERPDVDALYMQATLALHGHGGWPMTVFMTPDGRPFFAGTYFPPEPRGGLPGFRELLRAVADAYGERRDDIEAQADEVTRRLRAAADRRADATPITPDLVGEALMGLARLHDPANGGFGGAPKFPPSMALDLLLRRAWAHPGARVASEIAELTLARMAAGGIHDQLGGGFHRYSVDAIWLVPHFEKMLYDNALLIRVYALAARVTGNPAHADVVERAVAYLEREMLLPGGGFAAAQDADSPGGEGAYFVWTPEQMAEVLDDAHLAAARLRFGVTDTGNFEGGATVLHLAMPLDGVAGRTGGDAASLVEAARVDLLAARGRRPAPARDDKLVASWNGLAIGALADAGVALGRPEWVARAEQTADAVLGRLIVDGRLRRAELEGNARALGQLDDHADLCDGLLALYGATFAPRWLEAARELAARMVALFHDDVDGGFRYVGHDAEQLVARTRDLEDGPTPAGNSQAAWVLLRLAALTGDAESERLALEAVGLVASDVARYPQAFATALTAIDFHLSDPRQIAVVGDLGDPRTTALIAAARRATPYAVIAAGAPGDARASDAAPLLAGRGTVDGAPAAHVCRDFTCRLPVTDPEALAAELA